MQKHQKDLLMSLLRYLLHEMGDGETPIRKAIRKAKRATVVRTRKEPEVKKRSTVNPYDRIMKENLVFTSMLSPPHRLSEVRPMGG